MSLGHARRVADGQSPPTDYHALGAFTETWAFLELFLGRCAELAGAPAAGDAVARARDLDALIRSTPGLAPLSPLTAGLAEDVAALSLRRQDAVAELARASLRRMGLDPREAPPAATATLDDLHLNACDLVRRCVLLLGDIKTRRAAD